MAETDVELMTRYCDGDAAAFRALYARVAPRLLAYLIRMAGSRPAAEDLLQHTFLKVHRARGSYVRNAEPLPWFYAIAHRTFLDSARKKKRARVELTREDALPEVRAHVTGRPEADVHEPRHDQALRDATLEALDRLPENQREALVLTKLQGKSIAEAAAIMGVSRGAVKLRVHRGYVTLRKRLGERAS